MNGDQPAAIDAAKSEPQTRQRSAIAFPYNDLKASIEMAEALHNNVGLGECDDDQLAAWTEQSSKSSGFRVQVSAARMFGVLAGDGGRHRLTELGRELIDPHKAREAKVRAFLTVPLYKAVFDKYKGGVIPPAAALERDFVGLGVAEKQKDRARQVFERSADQAGFFAHGKNRLVAPGIAPGGTAAAKEDHLPPDGERNNGGGGGGAGTGSEGGGLTGDPLVDALVKKLPAAGKSWPAAERATWIKMIGMAFDLAYGPTTTSEN